MLVESAGAVTAIRPTLPILLAALAAGCQPPPVTPPPATRIAMLQTAVETGVDAAWTDPCIAPMLWAVLDGHEGEKRLNRLVTSSPGESSPRCRSLPAEARLLRRYRLGPVDLHAELAQPFPEVRSAALALVRRQKLRTLAEPVRALLKDSDPTVQLDAIATAVALEDTGAAPILSELLASSPEDLLKRRLCAGLQSLQASGTAGEWRESCEPMATDEAMEAIGSTLPGAEQEQLCNEENARVRGLLATGDWEALARPLVRFLSREFSDVAASLRYGRAGRFVACRLHADIRDRLLEADSALRVPRALVAATLLWQIHPRVGGAMLEASPSIPATSWGEPPWLGPHPLPGTRALPTPFDSELFKRIVRAEAEESAPQR